MDGVHDRARRLRHEQTDAERLLWRYLRNRLLVGAKFRRQRVIGRYICDFVCIERQLVIELDGGQHLDCQRYDQQRTVYLQQQGFRVIRFWNDEVLVDTEAVLAVIVDALNMIKAPSP